MLLFCNVKRPFWTRPTHAQHHVGDILVVEERGDVRVPVGIVTDRDLVVEIMATRLNQTVIIVGDIKVQLITVKESAGLFETI